MPTSWTLRDGFPVLTTARTVLREITSDDAEDLFVFRSDPEEQRHNDPPLTSLDQAHQLIYRLATGYREGSAVRWGLTLRGEDVVVGLLGYLVASPAREGQRGL